jgi:NAD(P)-dependent dehydrogenase (short-subunit alcohol dehydrogenase family)
MTGVLDGRVALVTGAARGQGEAIGRRFVREGTSVLVTDVLTEPGRAARGRAGRGGDVRQHVVDRRSGLVSDAAGFCTGSEFVIDGGMSAGVRI